jgi:hypothetical protein
LAGVSEPCANLVWSERIIARAAREPSSPTVFVPVALSRFAINAHTVVIMEVVIITIPVPSAEIALYMYMANTFVTIISLMQKGLISANWKRESVVK